MLLGVLLQLLLIVLKLLRNLGGTGSAILRLLLYNCRWLSPIRSISTVVDASSTNQKWIDLAHGTQMISEGPRSRCDHIMHQILI